MILEAIPLILSPTLIITLLSPVVRESNRTPPDPLANHHLIPFQRWRNTFHEPLG